MTDENNEIKNLEFLVIKSRDLLQEQLKSYEGSNSKAGILISISSLLLPITIYFFSSQDFELQIKFFAVVPTGLVVLALVFLLKVLLPKGLDHGFNVNQFDEQLKKKHKDLMLYEIGANRDSFRSNETIVNNQTKNFKTGVWLIFSSTFMLLILIMTSLFIKTPDSIRSFQIDNLNINDLNINKMDKDNSNSDSSSNQENQGNQSQQSSSDMTNIPSVPSHERANINKGDESKPLTK